ncbi:hypothetical protein CTI12_AA071270 [Artemisia annua]|uniref:Uncharacterized protein n=1 Tax=Artemisia annua TaxID=35608 RepID=A0A2U1Q4J1_ARTAN|nr:hypothetical protein CTI12_AA071270 [Artemisia annua]
MASSLSRLVSSKFLRVRLVGSFSRFFNTKGFQYDQHDSWDECILKCGHKHGSLVHDVINDAFSPCHSPTANLARLLNMEENRIGFGPCKLPRWRVVEDDKAFYLLSDSYKGFMSEEHEKDVEESVTKEFMSGEPEKDAKESLTKKELVPKKENVPKKLTERRRDLTPLVELITGDKIARSEYYYHLMKDAKELDQFAESIKGGFKGTMDLFASIRVFGNLENPQAIHIIPGLGGRDTDDPFGGYAIEIFLPYWFYKIEDAIAKINDTDGINITIPKKKDKSIQTIGGNIIFFQERKIWKPTLWRPT